MQIHGHSARIEHSRQYGQVELLGCKSRFYITLIGLHRMMANHLTA